MKKKIWNNPEMFDLGVEATQGGGKKITVHDNVYGHTPEGYAYEEYRS
ncbi:hypothetical protein [Clostridium kluyveri]|nr:hypothetical protein [Clostridium kluyveri]UZQ50370.1 hypothetical protein OP486_20945 [Clostridium kluyveri]